MLTAHFLTISWSPNYEHQKYGVDPWKLHEHALEGNKGNNYMYVFMNSSLLLAFKICSR